MWLFVLSVLAIGRTQVQSVAIGYPYHNLWSYNPNVQDQYPLKSGSIHSYLRYLDNNGAVDGVNYNNAQPVYAVRQVNYVSDNAAQGKSNDVAKIRETCIRAVSLQQYQNLKRDIDAIRSEGKQPAAEKILRLQTFEKIAFTSDFSLIADLPDVKLALKDLNENIEQLFEESVKQVRNQQSNQEEVKIYGTNSNEPLVVVEETPEQRQAREEHLRIYNEQIAHLKQLELEHEKYVQEASLKSKNPQSQNVDNAKALAELERAQQEHFRLWNEAKLRAEQADEGNKEFKKEKIIPNTSQQPLESDIFQNLKQTEVNEQSQAPRQVVDTPEVTRAREEHLRLVHEANSKAQAIEQQEQKGQKIYSFSEEEKSKLTLDPNIKYTVANQNGNYAQNFNNYMFDNKHVNTVPVANQKISLEQSQISQQSLLNSNYRAEQPTPVVDTPEVIKARAEHLRLVQEANLQAQLVEQKDLKQKDVLQSSNFNSNSETLYIVQDTPEVVKARAEHLRLVQEANLQAQLAEQQELIQKQVSHTPDFKSQNEHAPFIRSETSENAKETPEIVQLSEKIVRPVSGLNTKISPSLEQQAQIVEETPEVQQAREEHLRIFNAIKSHTEQEQAKQSKRFPDFASIEEEEARLLELESLREKERLQKEQQQLELDRMIEAERLAEEKRQMEAELLSLRLEEEQRLEMERLLEAKRLQEEQEELQKLKTGEYQEIIIENDSTAQQPLLSATTLQFVDKPRSQQVANVVGQYANNPFLKVGQISSEPANRLEHSVAQQSSHLKIVPVHVPTTIHQHTSAVQQSVNTDAAVRRVPSSHHSSENKHQYIKDDNIKNDKYNHNTASSQPADTAVPFSDLERATREHFRAHEQALEQLRLARLQNPSVKDCN